MYKIKFFDKRKRVGCIVNTSELKTIQKLKKFNEKLERIKERYKDYDKVPSI